MRTASKKYDRILRKSWVAGGGIKFKIWVSSKQIRRRAFCKTPIDIRYYFSCRFGQLKSFTISPQTESTKRLCFPGGLHAH